MEGSSCTHVGALCPVSNFIPQLGFRHNRVKFTVECRHRVSQCAWLTAKSSSSDECEHICAVPGHSSPSVPESTRKGSLEDGSSVLGHGMDEMWKATVPGNA